MTTSIPDFPSGKRGIAIRIMAGLVTVLLLAGMSPAEPADAGEELMLYAPKNLARRHLGAGVVFESGGAPAGSGIELSRGVVDTNRSIDALLVDDVSIGVPVSRGRTVFVVSLPDIQMLQTVSFGSRGLAGTVSAEVSTSRLDGDATTWRPGGMVRVGREDQQAVLGLGFADAKYLRITVEAEEPGRIYGFGAFGEALLLDYSLLAAPEGDGASISSMAAIDLSLAGGFTGARVLYLSGQDAVNGASVLDGDSVTGVSLVTEEGTAHAVVDLREHYLMDRAAALYSGFKGDVRVYVVEALPKEGEPDGAWLRNLTPVAESTDSGGMGIAGMDFEATVGRYVVFEWVAAEGQGLDTLSVAEVGAFSSPSIGGLRVMGSGNGGGGYGYGKDGYGKNPPGGKEVVVDPGVDPEDLARRELDMLHRHLRYGYFPGGSGLTSQILSSRPIFGDPLGPANQATSRKQLREIIEQIEKDGQPPETDNETGGGQIPPTFPISP